MILCICSILSIACHLLPGTQFDYCNFNFVIAAYIVETVSNQTLQEYIRTHIAGPLSLNKTMYDPSDGLSGSIPDYLGGHSYSVEFTKHGPKTISGPWRDAENTIAVANGAGGIISTTSDMVRWYLGVIHKKM